MNILHNCLIAFVLLGAECAFSNDALGCKICIPNYLGRQKEDSSKKAEDIFPNANYMKHINGSVF